MTTLVAIGWSLWAMHVAAGAVNLRPHDYQEHGCAPPACAEALRTASQAGGTAGVVGTIIAFFESEDDDEEGERVNAAGRGSDAGPLSMPLVASSTRQSMVAGIRPFHLAWVGGQPPFEVQMSGPSGHVEATWQRAGKRIVTATISLPEGAYEVTVTDAGGQSVLAGFDVAAQAPTVDEQVDGALSADQRLAVIAARLSTAEDGAWQLEAYEQLAAVPNSRVTAVTARRLAKGLSIADLGAAD